MNEKEKDKLAYETALYWAHNCIDDDFYDNCIDTIMNETNNDDEVNEIWNIIENKYLNIN